MRRMVNVIIALLMVGVCLGLLLCSIGKVREAACRMACRNNLKQMGIDLHNYQDQQSRFPAGTVFNADLSPDRRLSWYVGAWGYVGDGQEELLIDRTKGWEAPENRDGRVRYYDADRNLYVDLGACGGKIWECPGNPNHADPGMAALTHYVGVAGLGQDAAGRPRDYPGAGVFGYDPSTPVEGENGQSLGVRPSDIKDGVSTTMMAIETAKDNGPWIAGGPSTVRGLDLSGIPYLGRSGQFGGTHSGGANVLFADGSVRFLHESISPRVFEDMATIAGGEDVGPLAGE